MKYIITCTIALILCILIGYLLALIFRTKFKNHKHLKMCILTIGFSIVLLLITSIVYLNIYYHADDKANIAMNGNDNVTVSKIDGGYLFDGPGEEKALVFYQGAKVECKAYAPLMLKLSEEGYDCFLADIPFNVAIFGTNIADKFIDNYDYETWIISGHSMGGLVASTYANNHKDTIDDIVLLASYPSSKIDDDISLCSIYGTQDGCLDLKNYENNKTNWPKLNSEKIIEGGNHSGYANYGEQDGDNKANISNDEQQNITVKYINEFLNKNK